jgi:putative ABC transport system substrate-binding protein
MKRRQFITLVGGAAAAWPFAAPAQQSSNKIPVVGVLWHAGSADEEDVYLSVLVKAFNDLGYVEGKNIHLEHRFPAENPERFRTLARELVEVKTMADRVASHYSENLQLADVISQSLRSDPRGQAP